MKKDRENQRSIYKKFLAALLIICLEAHYLPIASAWAIDPASDASSSASTEPFLSEELPTLDPLLQKALDEEQGSYMTFGEVGVNDSAMIRQPLRLRELLKKDYKAGEDIVAVIDNANTDNIHVTLTHAGGDEVSITTREIVYGQTRLFKILSPSTLVPGRYTLTATTESGSNFEQDFTWGVLAINTNKSMYMPKETAHLALAVLDEKGNMICDATVTLTIYDPQSASPEVLSTKNGKINTNPECLVKDKVERPDYEASYQVRATGVYQMKLIAETGSGEYHISDSFEVRDNIPFDVERFAPTRIFPSKEYDVTFSITANQDFSGTISEMVPESFAITKQSGITGEEKITDSITADSEEEVLGAAVVQLGIPFHGRHVRTLGFGQQLQDPVLKRTYSQFGLSGHDGVDFDMAIGTPVLATDDGKVVLAKDADYGLTIVIQHSWGKSYYGHLSKLLVSEGTVVKRGQEIGLSGNSGLSTGAHLHFGIKLNEHNKRNGYYGKINPAAYLGLEEAKSESQYNVKFLNWPVRLDKGESIVLSYSYDAPDTSPDFYTTGPLTFHSTDDALMFQEARQWQIAVDSVVVNGGIVDADGQFGGLERKVEYVNGNWYAFYNDGGIVSYKKSSDGITWGSAVDISGGDADNFNPTVAVNSGYIAVAWIDTNNNVSSRVEVRRIDTNSSDTLTSVCSALTIGTAGTTSSTFLPTIVFTTSVDNVYIIFTDTGSDTEVNYGKINVSICSINALETPSWGDIQFGSQHSGLTASDRPQMISLDSNSKMMIFQDGNLSSSVFDYDRNEWRRNNQTIASVTDNEYSSTTDGTNVWLLSKSGTTATNFYHYPKANTNRTETLIDSDTGVSGDEQKTEVDMWCPPSDAADCKFVYVDNMDSATPDLIFGDCNDEACSSPTLTTIDSDTGSSSNSPSPSLSCVSVTDCKIAHGDVLGGNSPDMSVIDCNDATCSAPSQADIDTDVGGGAAGPAPAIWCPFGGDTTGCKVIYFEDATDDLFFADCSAANCSTRNTLTAIALNIDVVTDDSNVKMSIDCLSVTDCRVVYHDNDAGDLSYIDCANAGCTAPSITDIDTDVGTGNTLNVPNAIDCGSDGTDCKILYANASSNDVIFIDCASAACATSPVRTTIDHTAGGLETHGLDLDCPSVTNCKGVFVGNTTVGSEDQYFFDCNDASCTSGTAADLDNPPTRAALSCPASTNCKLLYYDAVESSQPPLYFTDCKNEDCLPEWETLTAPFTGATNLSSVSLTYDSTNSDLIASVIKDASSQAYYKSTDATTISWSNETAYDFTAGDLSQISTPMTVAGTTNMGAFLRQGSNMEFDLLAAAVTGPSLEQLLLHGKWFSGGEVQPFTF